MKTLAFLCLFFAATFAATLVHVENPLPDRYIVSFHDNATSDRIEAHMSSLLQDNSTTLLYRYQHTINGYAAVIPKRLLGRMISDDIVNLVEPDQMMYAIACVTQSSATWGISRISMSAIDGKPVNTFNYPDTAGTGVTAYIIDTGIYLANNDFGGRATFGFRAETSWSQDDKNGHGTHVASTVAGTVYGVAKKASLVAVKVLGDNGSGTNAGVIAGVNWVASNKKAKSVANMSLGGGYSAQLNTAVDKAAAAGVVMVVAAGNDNKDASNYSPASSKDAITVGSTQLVNSGGRESDQRSSFSNWGPHIDVFAPGSAITAAWIGGPTRTNTISGTSMASPHICGIAALLCGQKASCNSHDIKNEITKDAKTGHISMGCTGTCGNSHNRMGYVSC